MTYDVFEEREDGVLLKIRVTPNSESFKINKVDPWRNQLEVSVSSPPEKGKANKELLEKFENILGKEVRIFSGHKSREKKIIVHNASTDELKSELGIDI